MRSEDFIYFEQQILGNGKFRHRQFSEDISAKSQFSDVRFSDMTIISLFHTTLYLSFCMNDKTIRYYLI